MFAEDQLLPLSGLQHLVYCERQAALVHIEQVWADNAATAEGRLLHERVDEGRGETRGDVRMSRAVPLRSLRLGLSGIADVVEYHRQEPGAKGGIAIRGSAGLWIPFPIEYKRGRPKAHRADEVQVCAQALCLEEMLETDVPRGALFYGKTQHRTAVEFDKPLRALTEAAAARFRELVDSGVTPPPRQDRGCEECSLLDVCQPHVAGRSTTGYLEGLFRPDEPPGDLDP